jgi:hypothetical protein
MCPQSLEARQRMGSVGILGVNDHVLNSSTSPACHEDLLLVAWHQKTTRSSGEVCTRVSSWISLPGSHQVPSDEDASQVDYWIATEVVGSLE